MGGLEHEIDVVPTFLGAHIVPREFSGDADGYVDLVVEMVPSVASRAQYCDVSCDPTGFTVAQCERIAAAARACGLGIRVHADQTGDSGGGGFAADIGAASADHLEAASDDSIAKLAESDTVAMLMPSVAFHLFDPAFDAAGWVRRLRDSGVCLAIASDYNPGSAPNPSLQEAMRIAARLYRLGYADLWHMATINAAHSLGRADEIGSIEVGKRADLVVWDVPHHGMVLHQFGANLARSVIKSGRVVV